MQCKDIPDGPILGLLLRIHNGEFTFTSYGATYPRSTATLWAGEPYGVGTYMPAGAPEKLIRAKMAGLVRRGLVSGCTCGCRGDFELTPKGLELALAH